MKQGLTIGAVSKLTGLSVKAIRFYEEGEYIPAVGRAESGYRLYSRTDIRRLRLVRQARLLGLPLAEIKLFVEKAFAADCYLFTTQLTELFDRQRIEINNRISELESLREDLDRLQEHVKHCDCDSLPDHTVADCDYCPIIDEEGGEQNVSQL